VHFCGERAPIRCVWEDCCAWERPEIGHATAPVTSAMNARRFIFDPPAADEMSRDYQFSAHNASVCSLWVGNWPGERGALRDPRGERGTGLRQPVGFGPERGRETHGSYVPRDLSICSNVGKGARYSITSSALTSTVGGISRPRALAVFKST